MHERYIDSLREAFFPRNSEKKENLIRKRIEITRRDKRKLAGVLVEKSVFIPLQAARDSEELDRVFRENLAVLGNIQATGIADAVSKFLEMPLHIGVDGIYTDGDSIGNTAGLHLHPDGRVSTQKEFLNLLKKVLAPRGLKVSVKKSL